jgi:hypothetical protein
MSKAKSNVNELLAAIKRQTAEAAPPPTPKEEPAKPLTQVEEQPKKKQERRAESGAVKKPKSKIGKAVQFWMHDEDIQLVRELSAWLAGQGLRPSDSMVIRAALRYAKTGNVLLEAYRQASKLDGRLKQD